MPPRWLVPISLSAHAAVIFGIYLGGSWHIERLEAAKARLDLTVNLPHADAEGGPIAVATTTPIPKKKPVQHVVQPTALPPARPEVVETGTGAGSGSGSGSGSGTGSATDIGTCAEPPCGEAPEPPRPPDPPKPVATRPQLVAPIVLRNLRTAGDTQLQPPDVVKTTMARDGRDHAIAAFKICLGSGGEITSVTLVHSSGYEAYDRHLSDGISTWRYRPYTIDGHGVPVCSMVSFNYTMK